MYEEVSGPDLLRAQKRGTLTTPIGEVHVVDTQWRVQDIAGHMGVRFGYRRYRYHIEPGIYAVGEPDETSVVIATANYKPSFDHVRKNVEGHHAWILVLDTHGINVWCAAGKGTFGTGELIRMIQTRNLDQLVSHRKIIVPQLGAPGISAVQVQRQTGFTVVYGPVRARDISAFISADFLASETMRDVTFTFTERMALAPLEWVHGLKYYVLFILLWIAAVWFLIDKQTVVDQLPFVMGTYMGALLVGTALFPALLPWLPGRAFSVKGLSLAIAWMLCMTLITGATLLTTAHGLLQCAIILFLSLNFTGSTTFTSLSGVKLETARSIPMMALLALVGMIGIVITTKGGI